MKKSLIQLFFSISVSLTSDASESNFDLTTYEKAVKKSQTLLKQEIKQYIPLACKLDETNLMEFMASISVEIHRNNHPEEDFRYFLMKGLSFLGPEPLSFGCETEAFKRFNSAALTGTLTKDELTTYPTFLAQKQVALREAGYLNSTAINRYQTIKQKCKALSFDKAFKIYESESKNIMGLIECALRKINVLLISSAPKTILDLLEIAYECQNLEMNRAIIGAYFCVSMVTPEGELIFPIKEKMTKACVAEKNVLFYNEVLLHLYKVAIATQNAHPELKIKAGVIKTAEQRMQRYTKKVHEVLGKD